MFKHVGVLAGIIVVIAALLANFLFYVGLIWLTVWAVGR